LYSSHLIDFVESIKAFAQAAYILAGYPDHDDTFAIMEACRQEPSPASPRLLSLFHCR